MTIPISNELSSISHIVLKFNFINYLYEGKGKDCAGQSKAKASPDSFSKVPNVFESEENLGTALPMGSNNIYYISLVFCPATGAPIPAFRQSG